MNAYAPLPDGYRHELRYYVGRECCCGDLLIEGPFRTVVLPHHDGLPVLIPALLDKAPPELHCDCGRIARLGGEHG